MSLTALLVNRQKRRTAAGLDQDRLKFSSKKEEGSGFGNRLFGRHQFIIEDVFDQRTCQSSGRSQSRISFGTYSRVAGTCFSIRCGKNEEACSLDRCSRYDRKRSKKLYGFLAFQCQRRRSCARLDSPRAPALSGSVTDIERNPAARWPHDGCD